MLDRFTENVIEFESGSHTATVTFSNRKHINRVKKIYTERPNDFKYFKENEDGSICCKIPMKWIKINPGKEMSEDDPRRTMSPERKEKLVAALQKYRENKKKESVTNET